MKNEPTAALPMMYHDAKSLKIPLSLRLPLRHSFSCVLWWSLLCICKIRVMVWRRRRLRREIILTYFVHLSQKCVVYFCKWNGGRYLHTWQRGGLNPFFQPVHRNLDSETWWDPATALCGISGVMGEPSHLKTSLLQTWLDFELVHTLHVPIRI